MMSLAQLPPIPDSRFWILDSKTMPPQRSKHFKRCEGTASH